MKLSVGILPGTGKSESQDTAFFNRHVFTGGFEIPPEEDIRCLGICDGVGGNAGGRTAAEFVAARFAGADFSRMIEDDLARFLQELNQALLRHAASCPGQETMATTLSCILSCADGFYLVHAGNTRIYALQGAYLKQLTEDHTHRARLLRGGQAEAAAQCPGHIIYCCLGGGTEVFAGNLVLMKLPYDALPGTLLLTSDGIHDFVTIDELEDLLAAPVENPEKTQSFLDAALKAGSSDDMTVLIARMY